MSYESVEQVERRIRDMVSSPRRSAHLRQDAATWHQLCSAMDAIGDTQLAMRSYTAESRHDNSDDGWSYLIVYGILQVLYVQQDAARTISRCLGVEWKLPDELDAVRDVRNLAIGHPTTANGGAVAISRPSLSTTGFTMLVYPKDGGRPDFKGVGIRDLVKLQMTEMTASLGRVVERLVADELEHRRAFRGRPLGTVLHTVSYAVEKVAQGLRDPIEVPRAAWGLDTIRGALTEGRSALAERGVVEAYADTVGSTIDELEFVVRRLGERLKGSHLEWEVGDVEVYHHYLQSRLEHLRDMFDEIDEAYASDDVS